MRSARRSAVDTISYLPCNVLDRILGCLPLKDAVKTSVFSKDWRYKWVTRQELEFDDNLFKSPAHVQEAKTIIYQVLLLHQGPILKFRLRSNILESCPDINHWILFLSKKNVQEFTLHICSEDEHHLPSHLFTFHQLRHLELHYCYFNPPSSFKGFDRLVNLELLCVTLVPPISRNLISMCPFLERVSLWWCIGFDILEIDATNLKCFEFRGESTSICFKNAPMLRKVTVMYLNSFILTDASPVRSNLVKFSHYMPSLRELDIDGRLLQCFTMGGAPESPLTVLNNVKSLSISRMSFGNIENVSNVVYLITSCPKLEKLKIECLPANNVAEPVNGFLRAQSVSYDGMKLLQRVRICIFLGLEMEMEFVRLILASAPILEEISIWTYECILVQPSKQIIDQMKQYRRASPNIEFVVDGVGIGHRV